MLDDNKSHYLKFGLTSTYFYIHLYKLTQEGAMIQWQRTDNEQRTIKCGIGEKMLHPNILHIILYSIHSAVFYTTFVARVTK